MEAVEYIRVTEHMEEDVETLEMTEARQAGLQDGLPEAMSMFSESLGRRSPEIRLRHAALCQT